jgi:hypothetical protein
MRMTTCELVVIFLLFQRQIVQSIANTVLKG